MVVKLIFHKGIGRRKAAHRLDRNDNDAVEVIRGTWADVEDAAWDARRTRGQNLVAEIVIAPELDLPLAVVDDLLDELRAEFGFASVLLLVRHDKPRTGTHGAPHFHALVPMVDPVTGTRFNQRSHRARARKVVEELAVRYPGLVRVPDGPPRPAPYRQADVQRLKRAGIAVPALHRAVRDAAADGAVKAAVRAALRARGLDLAAGPGGLPIIVAPSGVRLIALHRLLQVRASEMASLGWTEVLADSQATPLPVREPDALPGVDESDEDVRDVELIDEDDWDDTPPDDDLGSAFDFGPEEEWDEGDDWVWEADHDEPSG